MVKRLAGKGIHMPRPGRNRERKEYKGRGKALKNTTKENRIRQFDMKPLIIGSTLCFTLLIFATLLAALKNQTNTTKYTPTSFQPHVSSQPTQPSDSDKYIMQMTAVITGVDAEQKTVTFVDVQTDEIVSLEYTGGSDIRSKYDKVIAGAQLNLGDMAEVTYQGVTRKILSLKVNAVGWEYNTISDLIINTSSQTMSFLGSFYLYSDGLFILSNGKKISLNNLAKSDVLTIRGYEKKVCSIQVSRGHGYLKLTEDEDFIGGTIDVGMLMSAQIQKGMILTVPEGNYDIRISNKGYSGEENITITRDQTSTLRADVYGPTGVQKGRVTFQVIPEDAILTIDGQQTFFAIPVELDYGEHEVEVALGGYQSYQGTITVNRTESSSRIILSENEGNSEEEDPESSEDNQTDDWKKDDWNEDDPNEDEDDWKEDDPNEDEDDWKEDDWNEDDPEEDDPEEDDPEEDDPEENDTTGEDSTSEVSGVSSGKDENHSMTIQCNDGVKVYIDGIYVGEIENGKVVLPKYLGTMEVTLMLGDTVKQYSIEVSDDKRDTEFSFPNLN